jgi:hypothetical protein
MVWYSTFLVDSSRPLLIIILHVWRVGKARTSTHSVTLVKKPTMANRDNCFCRRSATNAVERLSKRSLTKFVKAKGHLSPSETLLFASLCPAEQEQLILGFPVIEWDSDNEDGAKHPIGSEGGDEALCRDTAKLQVISPIATAVRPRRLSYTQDPVMSVRECGLVRSKACRSHLSLLDSSNLTLDGGRVP